MTMSHNNSNTLIYIDNTASPKQGVSIADIQAVLGITNRNDIGGLISRGVSQNKINPLALWKPFRSSEKGFSSTEAQRNAIKQVNGGFKQDNGLLPTYSANAGNVGEIPHAVWEYKYPRGKGGGTGGTDEWYRFEDFAPPGGSVGYYKNAVSPVGIVWPDKWRSSNLVIVLLNGNNYNWLPDLCLSFNDIVPSDSGYGTYNFGLILSSSLGKDLVLSPYTPEGVLSTGAASFHFDDADVNALASLQAGQSCTAAICLYKPASPISQQEIYHIPSDLNPIVTSLEIASNSDRITLEMGHDGSIVGMVVTISNLVLSTPSIDPPYANTSGFISCKQVNISPNILSIICNASDCEEWGQLGNNILGTIEFITDGAVLGNATNLIGGSITYRFAPTVNPSTQYNGSFVYGNTFPGETQPFELYVCKTANATQKIKARVTFSYDTTIYSNNGDYLEVTV